MRSGRAVVDLDVVNNTFPRRAVYSKYSNNIYYQHQDYRNTLPLRSSSARYTSPCCRSPTPLTESSFLLQSDQQLLQETETSLFQEGTCLACSKLDLMGHLHQEHLNKPPPPGTFQGQLYGFSQNPLQVAHTQWCSGCHQQEYGPPCLCSAPDDEKDAESLNEEDGLLEDFWKRSIREEFQRGTQNLQEFLTPKHYYNNPYEQYLFLQDQHHVVPSTNLMRSNSDCTVSQFYKYFIFHFHKML